MNRAIDAWYNDRAWFQGLQKRIMEQVGGRCVWEGREGGALRSKGWRGSALRQVLGFHEYFSKSTSP